MAKLKSLTINNNEVKDYIVDSGMSGGYTWIRYNSGIYIVDFTDCIPDAAFSLTYGSVKYLDYEFTSNSSFIYPFKSINHVTASIIKNSGHIVGINPAAISITESGQIHVYCYIYVENNVNNITNTVYPSFHIVGAWK